MVSLLIGVVVGGMLSMAAGAVVWASPVAPTFSITFPATLSSTPLDGRVILLLSRDLTREPRTHVDPDDLLDSPFILGANVDALAPNRPAILSDIAFGWPARQLSDLPAGDYSVQAVLNRYETFHLADGRVLKLPPAKGEGQNWAEKPGNLYSAPVRIHIDPAHPARISLSLDHEIPPIAPKSDSEYVRHIRIRSGLLSHFWGRDMYIGAHILLPRGFDTHPNAHYPLMVNHGHFSDDITQIRFTPPDPRAEA